MATSGDIVVIGAGIVGCAVASELARRGARVLIVDDRPAGMGATRASAGVLAPHIESRDRSALLDLTGRSLELFDEFVAGAREISGLPVTYCRSGTLDVALQPETLRRFEAIAAALGPGAAELLDARAVRAEEPHLSSDVVGGLLIPSHGFVVVAELVQALIAAAQKNGARLVESGRVRRIRRAGRKLSVETDGTAIAAAGVVLAAGSWAGQIEIENVPPPRVPVRPVRGQLLQLAWSGPPLRRVVWGERCYLVPWPDGTLLVGATVEEAGFDERTTVAGVRDLLEAACELVPPAWTAAFIGAKAGLRPGTPDELPVIGPSPRLPKLMYATGHYRNGVLLAPLTAKMIADAMLDNRMDRAFAVTAPKRFGQL